MILVWLHWIELKDSTTLIIILICNHHHSHSNTRFSTKERVENVLGGIHMFRIDKEGKSSSLSSLSLVISQCRYRRQCWSLLCLGQHRIFNWSIVFVFLIWFVSIPSSTHRMRIVQFGLLSIVLAFASEALAPRKTSSIILKIPVWFEWSRTLTSGDSCVLSS